MGFFGMLGEFASAAFATYAQTKAKLNRQDICEASSDYCHQETKLLIVKALANCTTASTDLTWMSRVKTDFELGKNFYLGALLAIDDNTKSTRRTLYSHALKTANKCSCADYEYDALRAATYSYLGLTYNPIDSKY